MRTQTWPSLILTLLLTAAPSFARADLEATVPFDFYAGKRLLPAGKYLIDIDDAGLIWISHADAGLRITVGSFAIGGSVEHVSKLVFHRYGGTYFLSELWVSRRASGRSIRRTPHEKEMAHNSAPSEVTLAATRLPVDR